MEDEALKIRHLQKSFGGHKIVDGLDISVARGECFGLLGANGAGKSTVLRLCLGLMYPDGGSIYLNGIDVARRGRESRMHVGVVPQFDNLDPDLTVAENLLVYGGYFGIGGRVMEKRLAEVLEFAELSDMGSAKITSLSGGMRRRLLLARSLVNDPEIILLDEPTAGLDPQAKRVVLFRLRALVNKGKAILITSHVMEEVERFCDRVAILHAGHKIVEGAPQSLISKHILPVVIEISGDEVPRWRDINQDLLANSQFQECGETLFVYTSEPSLVISRLRQYNRQVRYVCKASTLEDVFIKLTGSEVRG
jgi:lipooligosaccharide transport system ATP-binding protein